jgi:hypothetical protein
MAEMNYSELSLKTLDLTTVSLHLKNHTLHCIARRVLIQQRFYDQCGVRGGRGGLLLEKAGWLWSNPILDAVLRKPAVG